MPPAISAAVRSGASSRQGSLAGSPKASFPLAPVPSWGGGVSLVGGASSYAGSSSGFVTPPLGSSPPGAYSGPAQQAVGGGRAAAAEEGVRRAHTSPVGHLAGGGVGLSAAAANLPPGSPMQPSGLSPRWSAGEGGVEPLQAAERLLAERQHLSTAEEAAAAAGAGSEQHAGPVSSAGGGTAAALSAGLPLLSADYAINALVTRVAFDLLRRPDFQVRGRAGTMRRRRRCSDVGTHGPYSYVCC